MIDRVVIEKSMSEALLDGSVDSDGRGFIEEMREFVRLMESLPENPETFEAFLFPEGISGVYRAKSNRNQAANLVWHQLRMCVFREVYIAFCVTDSKYAAEMKSLETNIKVLIGAIAGTIAATLGVAVAVVSATTAVVLWLVLKIGRNTFCQYYASYYRADQQQ